jgi:hypothetical protein
MLDHQQKDIASLDGGLAGQLEFVEEPQLEERRMAGRSVPPSFGQQ